MNKKRQKGIENKTLLCNYMWQLQNNLFSMFDYTNLPFRKEFLEWELMRRGFVAVGKDKDNELVVGSISWLDFDKYGLPKGNATLFTRFGYNMTGEIGKDIVVGYNNDVRTPELSIYYYAKQFTEIDKSINVAVQKSRVSNIPVARNSKVKTEIDNVLTDLENGMTKTVAYEDLLDNMLNDNDMVKMLQLTDPKDIERVQYLSKLYDDLQRRFWNVYGISMNSTGKMAQVNEMELEGYEQYSRMTPLTMLHARQELVSDINSMFGTNITVTFSKPFQHILTEPTEEPTAESEEIDE